MQRNLTIRKLQDNTFIIDKNKLLIDIVGLSFYRAYESFLANGELEKEKGYKNVSRRKDWPKTPFWRGSTDLSIKGYK